MPEVYEFPTKTPVEVQEKIILSATTPTGSVGGFWYNTANYTLYFYAEGSWQAIHVLNPGVFYGLLQETGGTDYILLENDTDGSSFLALQA